MGITAQVKIIILFKNKNECIACCLEPIHFCEQSQKISAFHPARGKNDILKNKDNNSYEAGSVITEYYNIEYLIKLISRHNSSIFRVFVHQNVSRHTCTCVL